MTAPLPSIPAMRARLSDYGCDVKMEQASMPREGCECVPCDTVRVLDAVMPLLEDADVDWITRTTEHEATIRALLAPADTGGGG